MWNMVLLEMVKLTTINSFKREVKKCKPENYTCRLCNLEQKIVDKFNKLSKRCFSKECFLADLARFFCTNIRICLMDGPLGTHYQI